MSRDLVVLWDVDRTLLDAGPATRASLERTVAALLPGTAVGQGPNVTGSTDRQVLWDLAVATTADEAACEPLVLAMLDRLREEMHAAAGDILAGGSVLPGVREVLRGLRPYAAVQTVVTGNLRENAELKLRLFGLADELDLAAGAYGCEERDRTALVALARDRVAERLGRRPDPTRTWIVGDTPRDLACARAYGLRCALVATGLYGVADLAPLGPDAVLADLSDVDAVVGLLTSATTPA
ncbi:MAG TPA: haloacid dehalogenase-like hydrolase [Frankiaceae bacterium]|nr:haloacid dehalogenase-like hydrolase [Frankiaceae bacterium]